MRRALCQRTLRSGSDALSVTQVNGVAHGVPIRCRAHIVWVPEIVAQPLTCCLALDDGRQSQDPEATLDWPRWPGCWPSAQLRQLRLIIFCAGTGSAA